MTWNLLWSTEGVHDYDNMGGRGAVDVAILIEFTQNRNREKSVSQRSQDYLDLSKNTLRIIGGKPTRHFKPNYRLGNICGYRLRIMEHHQALVLWKPSTNLK